MFTDARSLWSMGTSAIASINENISTALEKIDAEIDAQDRQLSTRGDEEQLRIDLEQYKALLEDAQMQHFELSKQSRILIAEKEAELMILKKCQSAPDAGDSTIDSESSNLKYQKLFAEKMVLESSLKDAQEQLKRTLQERNEYQVMKKTYDELQTRFKNVKADLTSLKVEVDVKEKQKSETIDNLVSEYSKLAAETELYQQQSDLRVAEVLKENEVLVTKMHALEHSINEFADRSISPAPVMSSSVTSAAGLGTPGSKNNSRADLQATPAGSTSEVELKEAKSKIVNLQYDIKEKEVEISRLKAAALTNSAIPVAVATTASEGADVLTLLQEERRRCEEFALKLSKAQQDLDNQGKDVARLTVEKREADEAGRKYLEQCKRIQAQHDALIKAQRAQEDSNADRAESAGAAKASEQLLQGEIEALRQQLETQRTEHLHALAERDREQQQALDGVQTNHTKEVATLLEQHRIASSGTTAELEASAHQLRAQIAALTTQLTTTAATHVHELDAAQKDSVAQLAALEKEKSDISARLAQTEADMAALKASHEAELQASLSGGDADKQALVSQYVQQIDSLTADLRKAEGELVEGKTSLSSLREQLATATQTQQQEVADLKQSLTDAETAKAGLENQLAQKTEDMASAKAAHDAQLQASLSGGDAEKQALVAQYVQQIDTLVAEVSQAKEELVQKADAVKGLEEQLAASTTAHDEKIAALSAELAAAATEKSELAQQLAQKEEEKVNLTTTHETLLQELQTVSATEKQRLVDEHAEQVDVLQKQLTAAEGTLVEKDSELAALQAQLDSAQAEHATAAEKIAQLTAQLAEAVQAQEDQKSAHVEALQAQEAEAQEVLEAERAALNQQLQDVEESIGVLRESHREELLAELDAQSKQLSAEHTAALEQALATAAAEAASSQTQALGDQKQALEEDFAAQAAAAKELAEAEKAAALESNTVTLQEEKESALAAQASAHAESLSEALVALTAEKDTEREAALVALAQDKQQEMEAALEECEQAATALLETAQAEHAEKAAALNAEIDALKDELAGVEAKHQELTSAALAELNERRDQEQEKALTALRQELKALVDAAYKERDEHLENYSKERKLRKKIHNRLLEVQGNIRVLCRVRPILEVERRSGEDVDVTEVPNEEELFVQRDQQCRTRYEYDRVFPQTSSQEEVFEAVQPLCVSVLDGYNVCIFAYGQTGSGKTFTMEGSSDNRGVSPRAIAELLSQVEQLRETSTYSLTLSMLEIYNETILDLLPLNASAKEKEKLDIRQTADGNVVVGLTETTITSMAQVEELMKQGQKNRAVGSHDMNEHSSRSHSIITVTCRGKNLLDNTTSYGKLHLIDLAGSERVGKTDATGDRLKEAQNINKSLSALGEVINALGNKKATHVPYRNSKLTFLLQDSLGGNSKVLTFVNISPAVYNLGETVCSLNFATRCRTTELGQAKKQTGPTGEESATKGLRRVLTSSSTSSLNSSAVMTPAAKR